MGETRKVLSILSAQDSSHPLLPTNNYSAQDANSADVEKFSSRPREARDIDSSFKAFLKSSTVTSLHRICDKRLKKPSLDAKGKGTDSAQ